MKFLSSLSSPLSYFSFFMQHPKNPDSNTRKPWYERGRGMGNVWRGISKWRENGGVWKTMTWKCGAGEEIEFEYKVGRSSISSSSASSCNSNSNYKKQQQQQLRKCRSLKVATSFTRVCLCAPMSSYNELLRAEINNPPRRSNSFPRVASRPSTSSTCSSFSHSHSQQERTILVPTRLSTEGAGGRRVFRGKSLTDDVLMRRFVIEEEAMMHIRRRNQMEVIRKRTLRRRTNLGPSPLSRMVLAHSHPHHQQN